jgi:hypothetical protein
LGQVGVDAAGVQTDGLGIDSIRESKKDGSVHSKPAYVVFDGVKIICFDVYPEDLSGMSVSFEGDAPIVHSKVVGKREAVKLKVSVCFSIFVKDGLRRHLKIDPERPQLLGGAGAGSSLKERDLSAEVVEPADIGATAVDQARAALAKVSVPRHVNPQIIDGWGLLGARACGSIADEAPFAVDG